MIRKILTYYAERLEEYLSRFHRRPEGLATVGMIGNSAEERPQRLRLGYAVQASLTDIALGVRVL